MPHIRIKDIIYTLIKRKYWIIFFTIVGTVLGLILGIAVYFTGMIKEKSVITTSFSITSQTENGRYPTSKAVPEPAEVYLADDLANYATGICTSNMVLDKVIKENHLIGLENYQIVQALTVTKEEEKPILTLSLAWNDIKEGKKILTGIEKNLSPSLKKSFGVGEVKVIDPPVVTGTTGGNASFNLFLYLSMLGLFSGIGFSLLYFLLHPTMMDTLDIPEKIKLEVIAKIPKDSAYFSRKEFLTSDLEDISFADVQENFVYLAQLLSVRLKQRILSVTSSTYEEGVTTAVANLGIALSRLGKKVLLVDLNIRHPSLAGMFPVQFDYDHSLQAVLLKEKIIREAITPISPCLDLLASRMEDQKIQITQDVLYTLKETDYDFILLDTAPVGEVSDVIQTAEITNACLFVTRFDHAEIRKIQTSVERLRQSGMHVLGCIAERF